VIRHRAPSRLPSDTQPTGFGHFQAVEFYNRLTSNYLYPWRQMEATTEHFQAGTGKALQAGAVAPPRPGNPFPGQAGVDNM
jgi:hypothetical protein